MKRELLTEEMFGDWLDHPVTQALRKALALKRQERKDKWEEGNPLTFTMDTQMVLNAAAIGESQAYKYVQEMDLETLKGALTDDE